MNFEQEFEKIMYEITEDLFDAKYGSYLYRKINELIPQYKAVMNQTLSFWNIVLNSLLESSILSLSRAYDQDDRGIHLSTLIKFTSSNTDIFKTEKFQKRLDGNPYLEELSQHNRIPKNDQISADMSLTSSKEPLVKKLISLRSNIIAHKNRDQILGKKNPIAPMKWEEFDKLVDRGFRIRNHYSNLYNASTYAANSLIGKDDYQYVLKYLKIAEITLQFKNLSYRGLDNNCEVEVQSFLDEVKEELYKQL